jgi:hypothetical protein
MEALAMWVRIALWTSAPVKKNRLGKIFWNLTAFFFLSLLSLLSLHRILMVLGPYRGELMGDSKL